MKRQKVLQHLLTWSLIAGSASFLPAAEESVSTVQKARRDSLQKRVEEFKKLSPEEREAKRKEIRERMEKRVAELQQKKNKGTITESEARSLERMQKRLEQATNAPPSAAPSEKPTPKSPNAK